MPFSNWAAKENVFSHKGSNHAWVRDNIHGKIDAFKQATDQTTIELPWPLNITPKPSGKATLANASL
jgi:hypothetical protein